MIITLIGFVILFVGIGLLVYYEMRKAKDFPLDIIGGVILIVGFATYRDIPAFEKYPMSPVLVTKAI